MKTESQKPLLRWAGSKKKLLPVLSSYWSSDFKRYVEPFVGSACLFFSIAPKKAVLGDLNSDLIKTYNVVKSNPIELHNKLTTLIVNKYQYYQLRTLSPDSLSLVDAAARFIYLNRFCFNGLFRTNSKGEFNVPYGGERSGQLPTLEHLNSLSSSLKKASLKSGDFQKTLSFVKPGDFVYLDPPFAVENRRVFKQYGPQNFGLNDLERLSCSLSTIESSGAKFVLSYAYCKEALNLFSGWHTRKVFVRRNIAGFSASRRFAAEIIVSNIP
jgi:DNA adenine methylase